MEKLPLDLESVEGASNPLNYEALWEVMNDLENKFPRRDMLKAIIPTQLVRGSWSVLTKDGTYILINSILWLQIRERAVYSGRVGLITGLWEIPVYEDDNLVADLLTNNLCSHHEHNLTKED